MSRSVVIAVTGSIAAYRACDLVRTLTKSGLSVRVIMTHNAERFVGKVTFQAMTGHTVHSSEWEQGMLHIDAKNEAAVFAVVPATANMIGKMANGIADDLVSSTYLATNCPVLVAPAMNPFMYASAPVQRNLEQLRKDRVEIVDPSHGEVVCGDEGQGKIAETHVIASRIMELYQQATHAN